MGASPKRGAGSARPPEDKQATAPTLDGASPDPGLDSQPVTVRASRIGRFAIIREIGAGGMGAVYAAYDEQLDRKVALKILKKGDRGGQQLLTLREARAAARISHPNVIAVYEVGESTQEVREMAEHLVAATTATKAVSAAEMEPSASQKVSIAGRSVCFVAEHVQGFPRAVVDRDQDHSVVGLLVVQCFGHAPLAGDRVDQPAVFEQLVDCQDFVCHGPIVWAR